MFPETKKQDSPENKSNCFPRDHKCISVYYSWFTLSTSQPRGLFLLPCNDNANFRFTSTRRHTQKSGRGREVAVPGRRGGGATST